MPRDNSRYVVHPSASAGRSVAVGSAASPGVWPGLAVGARQHNRRLTVVSLRVSLYPMPVIHVRLSDEVAHVLRVLAINEGRPISSMAAKLIVDAPHIKELLALLPESAASPAARKGE